MPFVNETRLHVETSALIYQISRHPSPQWQHLEEQEARLPPSAHIPPRIPQESAWRNSQYTKEDTRRHSAPHLRSTHRTAAMRHKDGRYHLRNTMQNSFHSQNGRTDTSSQASPPLEDGPAAVATPGVKAAFVLHQSVVSSTTAPTGAHTLRHWNKTAYQDIAFLSSNMPQSIASATALRTTAGAAASASAYNPVTSTKHGHILKLEHIPPRNICIYVSIWCQSSLRPTSISDKFHYDSRAHPHPFARKQHCMSIYVFLNPLGHNPQPRSEHLEEQEAQLPLQMRTIPEN